MKIKKKKKKKAFSCKFYKNRRLSYICIKNLKFIFDLFVYLYIYLFIYLSIYLFIYSFIYLFIYLFFGFFVKDMDWTKSVEINAFSYNLCKNMLISLYVHSYSFVWRIVSLRVKGLISYYQPYILENEKFYIHIHIVYID